MLKWIGSLPLVAKLGIAGALVVVLMFGGSFFRQKYNHYKWGKSDAQVEETLKKSDAMSLESAKLKGEADQLKAQAKLKDAEIAELKALSEKYGTQAADAAKKVEEAYNELEKDTTLINTLDDAGLHERICSERAKLGYGNVGQCKGWKPKV